MPNSFHRNWGAGIDGNTLEVTSAIVLSGGYEDYKSSDALRCISTFPVRNEKKPTRINAMLHTFCWADKNEPQYKVN